ncbi:MAG: Hsp70 family protein, partial [Lachnospiraceae bacterium]|nr:Hsp70 family protein [Lachnospiraceae bacterium]
AEFEAQDKARKEGIDARNDADALVFQVKDALKQVGDKLDPTLKGTVENDLKALEDAINGTDPSNMTPDQITDIKAKKETLLNSANQLFQKVYEQAQAAQGQNPNMGGGQTSSNANTGNASSNGNSGDDVIDGDFKEV